MKNFIQILTLALAITSSQSVFAGAGEDCHFHGSKPAAKEMVLKCADKRVERLISRGKLDAGWKAIAPESITAIDGEKGKEWKVVIKNPAANDKTKATLYLFFSENGNFIAANHTGK
jgi:hypothetical protein